MEDKVKYYVVRNLLFGMPTGPAYVIKASSEEEAIGRSYQEDHSDMRRSYGAFESERDALEEADYLNDW